MTFKRRTAYLSGFLSLFVWESLQYFFYEFSEVSYTFVCYMLVCLLSPVTTAASAANQPERPSSLSDQLEDQTFSLSRGISILVCSWLRATKITILVYQRNIQKIWRKFSSHFHMQNFWAISTKYSVTAAAYLCPSFLTSITSTLSIQDTKPLMDVVLYAIDVVQTFLSDTCLIKLCNKK